MIVALVSQKGGVGKSTLARLLGVEAARAGWRVLIADLDAAQGTATAWHARRVAAELKPELAVVRYRSTERAIADAAGFDLAILDGPAHAERGGIAMATAADLVLLPTGFSLDDLEPQVRVAGELIDAGIPAGRLRLVVCRTRGSLREAASVRSYIQRADLAALERGLRDLPTIRLAQTEGRAASETGHKHISREARGLAAEIMAALTGAAHEQA